VVRRFVHSLHCLIRRLKVDVSRYIGTKCIPVSMIRVKCGGTTRGRLITTVAIIGEWSDDSSNTDSTRMEFAATPRATKKSSKSGIL